MDMLSDYWSIKDRQSSRDNLRIQFKQKEVIMDKQNQVQQINKIKLILKGN